MTHDGNPDFKPNTPPDAPDSFLWPGQTSEAAWPSADGESSFDPNTSTLEHKQSEEELRLHRTQIRQTHERITGLAEKARRGFAAAYLESLETNLKMAEDSIAYVEQNGDYPERKELLTSDLDIAVQRGAEERALENALASQDLTRSELDMDTVSQARSAAINTLTAAYGAVC